MKQKSRACGVWPAVLMLSVSACVAPSDPAPPAEARTHALPAELSALAESAVYTPPEASGLVGVRPYPIAADVCQVIGENDLTRDFLDDNALLVGCPRHETGAIADRQREGGVIVGQQGSWVLLNVPTS
ncbi:MAG: hypothetical protein AAFR73_01580 [Pseudomonadota bacterium]